MLLDEPAEHLGRTVGAICGEPFRIEAEAILYTLDHRASRADLCLANGARGLDVDNHPELRIDEIVVGVGEKGRPAG